MDDQEEERLLRAVALQNARTIMLARQKAEEELLAAKEALERKTEELAHSLSRMRATLEATTDGIAVTDMAGRVTDFNEKFARMWGLRGEALRAGAPRLAELGADLLPQPVQDRQRIEEIQLSSLAESHEVLPLTDGRFLERWSSLQVVEGRAMGRVWSFRDVTEQRRAEQVLREERQTLELLNKTGAVLSSKLDLQTLLQAVTDAATELSGARFGAFFYNVTDDSGETYMLYTLSGAPREAFDSFGQPRATPLFGPTFRGEGPIWCADVLLDPRYGQWGPHRGMPKGHLPVRSYLAVPVYSRSGEVLGGLFFGHPEVGMFNERSVQVVTAVTAQAAVAIDNARLYETAQKAAQERTFLLEQERRTNELKDEFLATLSHELRTPLSAILGWSQLLRRSGRLEGDLQRGLDTIERNARAQTRLIEDLLDMSRITSGKVRLDIQTLEPFFFVEAALETVKPSADAKGIRLEKILDPSAGPISGDPGRLQQVVWNLLTNAIKFTPKGGKVQVLLERVASHVEISVADTGVGISPEFLPHVFERFRQQDASLTRRHGGLGLGLSIVKHLVEMHGGSVVAASPGEGAGATFSVRLPLLAAHRPRDASRQHPRTALDAPVTLESTDLGGLRLLVVDDDPDGRELIRQLLSDCGAEVLCAGSATDALPMIERERPHLLISDIGMPDMDGYELLQHVRALGEARGGQVPAIALTAFARPEDRTRALRAGFLSHVAKPVEAAELLATVASVTGRMFSAERPSG
jgi:PAS domain S-box-containing protein